MRRNDHQTGAELFLGGRAKMHLRGNKPKGDFKGGGQSGYQTLDELRGVDIRCMHPEC